jgi:hypothetical protein
LPDDLNTFVLDHVDSIEQLEVLLLLWQRRERGWTASEVSQELRSAPESVAQRLKGLQNKKLLVVLADQAPSAEAVYFFQPESEKAQALVERLSEMYKTRRFSVINLILSRPSDSIRTFADAFKIKKSETNENG